ncbi:MAG: hypothetical protein PW788_09690 [Micavibrio sp.]|nr:hypothetical protein [Micavibrio sp.]
MKLQTADIEFLIAGEYALRYISGRPDLLAAHTSPAGAAGDGYSLSGLAPLLPASDTSRYPIPYAAVLDNKGKLAGLLEEALGKIVDRALTESPDYGGSLTFMLLKDMSGASSSYDVHPQHCPTGKAGRRHIKPEQIVSVIKLSELDVLEGEIARELGQPNTAKAMLLEKITASIVTMRETAPAARPKAPATTRKPAAP